MPTYLQLQAEPEWGAETVPPNLRALGDRLRSHYRLTAGAIGFKGDNRHLRGAHRSRRWIKNSLYCTSRTYTVSRTPGDRSGGDDDWLAGIDVTLPRADLIPACARLDAAVRAGRLEKITEWYGNDDGDNRVDGYDNIANRSATSDDSHLWHLHITFDRGRVDEDHSDVFAILTGTETTEAVAMAIVFSWQGQIRMGFGPVQGYKTMANDGMYRQWRSAYSSPPCYPDTNPETGYPTETLEARGFTAAEVEMLYGRDMDAAPPAGIVRHTHQGVVTVTVAPGNGAGSFTTGPAIPDEGRA